MSREKTLESIILKKQDFGETDQIITIFSKEEGKVRCMAKASKLSTSKLQPSLQPLFLSKVTLAGSNSLPKVIRVQAVKAFSDILSSQSKISAWFMVSEIIIRALPDGAPNERLWGEVSEYLNFINDTAIAEDAVALSTVQFQIKALQSLGFGIRVMSVHNSLESIYLSMDRGGFYDNGNISVDAEPISRETYELFLSLLQEPYQLSTIAQDSGGALQKLVNRFVTYQLEREIKSSRFL